MEPAKKILVVEDNQKNRKLLTDILKYHGYEVSEAADGFEGIRLAREFMPELIFMDIQMHGMDGVAALKALKADPATSGIKIIALTSFAMKGDKERFMREGFTGYITKPVDTRKLPVIVKQYMNETPATA